MKISEKIADKCKMLSTLDQVALILTYLQNGAAEFYRDDRYMYISFLEDESILIVQPFKEEIVYLLEEIEKIINPLKERK